MHRTLAFKALLFVPLLFGACGLWIGPDEGFAAADAGRLLPETPPFCTRSLANVDCWANPAALADHPRGVADGPLTLTPAQEANRTRPWWAW